MKARVSVDGSSYDVLEALGTKGIEQDSVVQLHSRYDIDHFVEKALDFDVNALAALLESTGLVRSSSEEDAIIAGDRIESGEFIIVRPEGKANGGSSVVASETTHFINTAPAPVSTQDHHNDEISPILSPDMRNFVAMQRAMRPNTTPTSQPSATQNSAINTSTTGSQTSPDNQLTRNKTEDFKYKIIIEIAGRNSCPKQKIELNDISQGGSSEYGERAQLGSTQNHLHSNHRSIAEFRNLPKTPRNITIVIPTKGPCADIRLPLQDNVETVDRTTDKPEWDNVLVPVRPLAYINKNKNQEQTDILKPGWIYVFWRGKLWRELEVLKNQAMRDVNVEYYRKNWNGDFGQEELREAEGHWVSGIWTAYKLGGELQTGANTTRIAYSEQQWDWPYIETLESDNTKQQEVTTALDFSAYSNDQHFRTPMGDVSSIETALLNQNIDIDATGYKILSEKGKALRSQRDSLIPVVFLKAAGEKFILKLQNKKGRVYANKKVLLKTDGGNIEGETDRNGQFETVLKPEQLKGKIDVWLDPKQDEPIAYMDFDVKEEQIPDVSTIAGQQTRLNNLGFEAGVVDGINGKNTKNATIGFQSNNNLDVDGICGPKTQRKLKQVYQQ
ncbi:hypothetical protein A9Q99_26740 [Gammaproteobacteria bacterium 45_16_T64]|nr:hypothetical protein A9Q99_26740 [Gammaproteobacteria bacterium 45_16_T64]